MSGKLGAGTRGAGNAVVFSSVFLLLFFVSGDIKTGKDAMEMWGNAKERGCRLVMAVR